MTGPDTDGSVALTYLVDGEECLTAIGLALVCSVPVCDAERFMADHGRHAELPAAWRRRGRRRVSEAAAHTGDQSASSVVRYWADQLGIPTAIMVVASASPLLDSGSGGDRD